MLPRLAIPSYKREETLLSYTLSYLCEEKYPPELIFIFVADEEEKKRYEQRLPRASYNSLLVGKKGLQEQRKVISEWAEEGEVIVQMDDDCMFIKSPHHSFLEIINKGVKEIKENKCGLFGIMPSSDGRRFKNDTTYHLAHILGTFFICKNHRDIQTTTSFKEDFERSILYFLRYGKVARYRGAGVHTTFQQGEGGLQCVERQEKTALEMSFLVKKYPRYVAEIQKAKRTDIMLNWRASLVSNDD
jgi:hypothetical protein